ncbi:MAG: DUF4157 domain-containing protein [Gammaproteobacteria bacterium]|nr:DUF4157 domain-containing protein [Gammaproteobacteria bacterium]
MNNDQNKPVAVSQTDRVRSIIRPKLEIGPANDAFERVADRVANAVMRMADPASSRYQSPSTDRNLSSNPGGIIQRRCQTCQEEDEKIRMMPAAPYRPMQTSCPAALNLPGSGRPLSRSEKRFFEPRFGADFSQVRIHQSADVSRMARSINARAFTLGNDVFFASGEYRPGSASSTRLLAHELTHVVQQHASARQLIQRKKHRGSDNYGTFYLDDSDNKFLYRQKWFYDFHSGVAKNKRKTLMGDASSQVKQQWSNKYKLIPVATLHGKQCPSPSGASVEVDIEAKEGQKRGKGVTVKVVPSVHANVNPVTGVMKVQESDFAGTTYSSGLQYTIAHEFGHTINITDEYNGWSKFFVPSVEKDKASMMNTGNSVMPRHYQYFGDILSLVILGCRYNPDGIRQLERENAVLQASTLSGLTTYQDGIKIPGVNSKYSLGMQYNLRVSNQRLFGLFYPRIGAIKLWNPDKQKTSDVGFTTGVSLGQIAHPLTVNLSTGVVINPMEPGKSVRIPLSIQAGLRTSKYEFGIHYTPVFDLLPGGGVTHLFGLGGRF